MGLFIRLLLFILVVYSVWRYGTRLLGGLMTPPERRPGTTGAHRIQEMTECGVCKTYVAAASGKCGRPDCPRRG